MLLTKKGVTKSPFSALKGPSTGQRFQFQSCQKLATYVVKSSSGRSKMNFGRPHPQRNWQISSEKVLLLNFTRSHEPDLQIKHYHVLCKAWLTKELSFKVWFLKNFFFHLSFYLDIFQGRQWLILNSMCYLCYNTCANYCSKAWFCKVVFRCECWEFYLHCHEE